MLLGSVSLSQASTPSPWVIFLILAPLILNIALRQTRPISPATLIYAPEDALLPVVISPFIVPTSLAALSRIFQLGWIISHKSSQRTNPVYLSGTYASLLATRCASGFFFSRSVGWAYPSLFSHAALYEPLFGFGPLLVGTILLDDLSDGRQMAQRLLAVAGLSFMDEAPWSYICGTLLAGVYRLAQSYAVENQSVQRYSTLPSWSTAEGKEDPDTKLFPLSRSRILTLTLLGALVSGFLGNAYDALRSVYTTPSTTPPGVHIVMLTVPRTRNLSSDIMIESISSYIEPWAAQLSSNPGIPLPSASSLTVLAHRGVDGTHPAFERAKTHFARAPVSLTFRMQPLGPDAYTMNHYVHLADAMQYAYEQGWEWTMFVEDDFVLCGEWGWDALVRVIARLGDPAQSKMNGAFVGTGGSGLIYRRSMLPTLRSLLLLASELDKDGAEHLAIAPDVLMQTCMTGEQSFCPRREWVISSRLLMGHRGWNLSTGSRVYTKEKWACGWRHPQHGMKGAEVIAV